MQRCPLPALPAPGLPPPLWPVVTAREPGPQEAPGWPTGHGGVGFKAGCAHPAGASASFSYTFSAGRVA